MDHLEASTVLEKAKYKIVKGVICLKKEETPEETEAINKLCSEWDYMAIPEEDFNIWRR